MKKTKFFSALTLVLMLLLTLSSCGGGAFLDNIDFDYKSDPVYTGAVEVTNISGTVSSYGNTLVYLYDTNSSGNQIHKVYNIDTGNVVFTKELGAVDSRSVDIDIVRFGKQDLFTVRTENNYVFESLSVHDENGTPIATAKTETELEIICNELIVFDNAVYSVVKNEIVKTADLDGSLKLLPSTDDGQLHVSKKYVYAIDDDEIVVYTKKGEFKYGYTAPSYAENTNFSILDNGKIVVQYLKELPEQSDKFDVIMNDAKYDIVTQIIDPSNGKIKNKNVDFMLLGLTSSYEASLSGNIGFKKDFNGNIAAIIPIEKDGFANITNAKLVELYNDLKIRSDFSDVLDYDTGLGEFRLVRDGVMVIEDSYDNLVFIKKNGKTLATFKRGSIRYSENFIVTDSAIYDYGMKHLYDFKTNDFEFVSLSDTFVILRKNNEHFRYTAGMEAPVSINSMVTGDQYEEIKLGMYCVKRGEEYAYLDATGKTIAAFSGKIYSSYVSESGNTLVRAGGKYYKLTF